MYCVRTQHDGVQHGYIVVMTYFLCALWNCQSHKKRLWPEQPPVTTSAKQRVRRRRGFPAIFHRLGCIIMLSNMVYQCIFFLQSPSHLQPFVSKPKPKRCQSERKAWTLRTALHAYHLGLRAACSSFACSMRLLSFVICSLWLLTVSLWLCEVLWKHALALLFNHQSLLKSTATAESPVTFYLFYLQTCSQIAKIRPWLVECVSRKLWIRIITFQPQISNISEFGRLGASIWLWGRLMSIVISGRSTNSLAGMRTYVTRMGTSHVTEYNECRFKSNRSRKSSNQTRWNRLHLSRSWVNGPWSELYLSQCSGSNVIPQANVSHAYLIFNDFALSWESNPWNAEFSNFQFETVHKAMPNQIVRQAANNATPWFQRHPLCSESTEFSKLIEFLWQICKEAAIFRTPSPVLPLLSLEQWKRQAWKETVSTILCEYKSQQFNNRWNPLLRSTVMNFVLRRYLLLLLLSPFLLNPKPQDGENGRGDENQKVRGRCTNFDGTKCSSTVHSQIWSVLQLFVAFLVFFVFVAFLSLFVFVPWIPRASTILAIVFFPGT